MTPRELEISIEWKKKFLEIFSQKLKEVENFEYNFKPYRIWSSYFSIFAHDYFYQRIKWMWYKGDAVWEGKSPDEGSEDIQMNEDYHFLGAGTSGRPAFQFGCFLFWPGKSGANFFL